jgi:multidrug efflux pump subunit AcrB
MRQVNQDWGERVPTIHFALDQDRLRLIGLSPNDAAQELQFLLTGIAITQVREDIRTVDVVARTAGAERLDPSRFADFPLTSSDGRLIPLAQVGRLEVRMEDPILKRRDRTPTIEVRGDVDESSQPPKSPLHWPNRSSRSPRACLRVIGSRWRGSSRNPARRTPRWLGFSR